MKHTTSVINREAYGTVQLGQELHRDIKIVAAQRNEPIRELIGRAWRAFKTQEGDRLVEPVSSPSRHS